MTDTASDTARLIAQSAASFAAAHGGFMRARERHDAQPGTLDRDGWQAMARLGWFGIDVPEPAGGLALGAPAACIVAEEAGRFLLMPPLTTAVAAASLLSRAAEAAAQPLLQALLAGQRVLALAAAQHAAGSTGSIDGSIDGSMDGSTDGAIDGSIAIPQVPDADVADAVVAGLGGRDDFEARLVERHAAGVAFDAEPCADGSGLGGVAAAPQAWSVAPRLANGTDGWLAWTRAIDLLRLGDAAYLCGVAACALAMGLDHLRLRHQFGVPIGSFQALQHRAADCHVQCAAARALVHEAARAFGTPRQSWAAAAAVRSAAEAAMHVAKENVQFHGAIGFADEHDAGLVLRRAMVVASRHGTQALSVLRGGMPRG